MKKRMLILGISVWLSVVAAETGWSATPPMERKIHAGLAVGFGLPKISFSQFRTPISVLGGGSVNLRLMNRIVLQAGGYGLHTFSLGKINRQEGELIFDLVWASVDLMYRMRGGFSAESFVLLGGGGYHFTKQFGFDKIIVDTPGLSLGISQWFYRKSWSSVLEIKWHLLFRPSDHPQVLTVTFGLML